MEVESSRSVAWKFVVEAAFVVTWSSGFVGATLGAQFAEVPTLLAWRYFFVAVLLLAWVVVLRRVWPSPRELARQVVIGLLSQTVYLGCVVGSAGVGVPGGVAALIAALQPLFAVSLAGPVLGEKAGPLKWVGLTVGFIGVLVVVGGEVGLRAGVPAWGYALPFVGMVSLVTATLVERKTEKHAEEVALDVSLAIQFVVCAVVFGTVAFALGELDPPVGVGFWFAVAWAVLPAIGGYGFYWLNVGMSGVGRVSSLLYLTPPTTMVWSYFMFGDRIVPSAIVGMAVCAAGVFLARDKFSGRTR